MNDRKRCVECDVEYSDESTHRVVHDAVMASIGQSAEPAVDTAAQPLP